MNQYITAMVIKDYREKNNMTQQMLADILNVSSKTISKWETGNGFPDISILEDLSSALGVSIAELFSGNIQENKNTHSNMLLTGFYVCPICGNVITAIGDAVISCHGITLVKEEAIETNFSVENIEDELFVSIDNPMTKKNYISFICGVSLDGVEFKKLYPEQEASVRLRRRGTRKVYYYSNREGLFFSNVHR